MTRRRAIIVLGATLVLFGALHLLVHGLYRSAARTVARSLNDRMESLGKAAARSIPALPDGAVEPYLRALVQDSRLEDAYVVSRGLSVQARASGEGPLNLMRIDPPRLARALEGAVSVAGGYAIAGVRIDSGYFPVARPGGREVLILEAGREFHAPAAHLRMTYGIAAALAGILAAVFALGMALALRSLERARVAHGRAERMGAMSQMAAMVAHEVRNPLGILRASIELLRARAGARLDEREQSRIHDMLAEVDRLGRLTQEFLSLAAEPRLDRSECDLAAIAAETADAVREAAPHARIELSIPDGITLSADRDKLKQVFLNLLLNAAQATERPLTIRVEAQRARATVAVHVSDDGPGIPQDVREKLFQPFVTTRAGGSGLGLTVARRIVEAHGGTLALTPWQPDAPGATFTLHLPVGDTI